MVNIAFECFLVGCEAANRDLVKLAQLRATQNLLKAWHDQGQDLARMACLVISTSISIHLSICMYITIYTYIYIICSYD